jgi:hypothetical protein
VLGKAFAEYSRALRTTQAALMDPERWRSDGVLAAVLLLGMFEVSSSWGKELVRRKGTFRFAD